MKVCLSAECYEPLVVHVPVTSPAHAALTNAVKIDGFYGVVAFLVDCSDTDTDTFLTIAQKHFPLSSEEIKIAIVQAAGKPQD